jgi:rod shape-determining protein MreC
MLDFLRTNRLRISVILVVILLIALLFSQIDRPRADNWFSSLVQTVAYPFQTSVDFVQTRVSRAWSHYVWLVDVREENNRLISRVKELEEQNATNAEIRLAHQRLRRLLAFKEEDPNLKVFADVVMEIRKPFFHLLVINKGSADGIRPNYGVVDREGIVGKVQSVTRWQSVVQLITDSRSQFPVLIQRTRTRAMLQVEGGKLVINQIPRLLDLFENDRIVSSGLAGIFPNGYPVGRISEITREEFGLFQRAVITPFVELNKIEEVAVIVKSVYNIHEPLFTDTE